MRVGTIILNRNLPLVTDKLCETLLNDGIKQSDLFVIEAGSDEGNISTYCTWHVRDADTMRNGLRYNRGMNQALINLFQSPKWEDYDAYLLLTNDTVFQSEQPIQKLANILEKHPRVAILSPSSKYWGENNFISKNSEKYFWSIGTTATLVRRAFIDSISNRHSLSNRDFLFDGSNFRGYLSDTELIAKAYLNDWAAAITTGVMADENKKYLFEMSDIIKTDSYDENIRLYLEEGLVWAKNKYGFQSKWDFVRHSKIYYDIFFQMNPKLHHYKI